MYKWLAQSKVASANGDVIDGAVINVKVKHTLVRKIFASKHIQHEAKKEAMAMLAKVDSSDMLGRTQKYCEAALPDLESKTQAQNILFEACDDMTLQHVQEMCRGFRQGSQREVIDSLSDGFFSRIEDCVNTKAWSLTRFIFMFLKPSMNATDETIAKFKNFNKGLETKVETLKAQSGAVPDGLPRLINWMKDAIQELVEKKAGQELSRKWERENRPGL